MSQHARIRPGQIIEAVSVEEVDGEDRITSASTIKAVEPPEGSGIQLRLESEAGGSEPRMIANQFAGALTAPPLYPASFPFLPSREAFVVEYPDGDYATRVLWCCGSDAPSVVAELECHSLSAGWLPAASDDSLVAAVGWSPPKYALLSACSKRGPTVRCVTWTDRKDEGIVELFDLGSGGPQDAS